MDYRKKKIIVSCHLACFFFYLGILLIFFSFSLNDQLHVLKEIFSNKSTKLLQFLFGDISVVTCAVELAGPNHSHSHTKRRWKVHSKNFSRKRHKSPLLSS